MIGSGSTVSPEDFKQSFKGQIEVTLNRGFVFEHINFDPDFSFQIAQEATNFLPFRFVHLNHLLREEGEQVVDDVGTLWIGGEMVLHKAEDAVDAPSVEAELVEGFGFFELAVTFIGGGGEVDAADGEFPNCCHVQLREIITLAIWKTKPEYL